MKCIFSFPRCIPIINRFNMIIKCWLLLPLRYVDAKCLHSSNEFASVVTSWTFKKISTSWKSMSLDAMFMEELFFTAWRINSFIICCRILNLSNLTDDTISILDWHEFRWYFLSWLMSNTEWPEKWWTILVEDSCLNLDCLNLQETFVKLI